jgi:hypothetical protein
MTLPRGFPFTQTALRAYRACPYQFRLRYIEGVPWSALPPDPAAEAAAERGRFFHDLARQHYLGLDVAGQAEAEGDPVRSWWAALRDTPPDLAAYPRRFPEAGLSIPLGAYRLAARYDLLAVGEGQALAVDWKTGAALERSGLVGDIQTRVYLYVLAVGGATYHGGRPLPLERIGLLYWHPQGPQQVHCTYSPAQQSADGAMLAALVDEIAARRPEEFLPTANESACAFCAYAALCGKGAGTPEWEPEEEPVPETEGWEAGLP